MHHRVFVPGLRGDLPRDVASAARRLEAAGPVLPHDAADDGEGEAHQHPGAQQQQHGGGRQGLRGAAPPVDGVHHAPRDEERRCGKHSQTRQFDYSLNHSQQRLKLFYNTNRVKAWKLVI